MLPPYLCHSPSAVLCATVPSSDTKGSSVTLDAAKLAAMIEAGRVLNLPTLPATIAHMLPMDQVPCVLRWTRGELC